MWESSNIITLVILVPSSAKGHKCNAEPYLFNFLNNNIIHHTVVTAQGKQREARKVRHIFIARRVNHK